MSATERLSPATAILLVWIASIATLAAAYGFQYLGGLPPCTLCYWQRIPYGIAIIVAASALLFARSAGGFAAAGVFLAVTFVASSFLGGFHVGVEQGWWEGPSACTGAIGTAQSIEDLKAQLLAAPVVRCDEIPWSLFGISLAGYNVLISLALAGLSAWALVHTSKGRNP